MTKTFSELGVSADLVTALAEQGILEPFPIQRLAIADGLAGRDVSGKAKTGSGKTIAFGVPLVERAEKAEPKRPRGLVLVPTRELALQVHDVLRPLAAARDFSVVAVYGGAAVVRQQEALKRGAELVVATPGRLIDLIERGDVALAAIDAVVIDEADRMADMGFLPQVEWLLRRVGGEHQTMLFSATLDGAVDGLIKRHQRDPVFHEVISETVTVEEMEHRFLQVHQMDKVKVAARIAAHHDRVLMFVRTKRGADRVASSLEKEGVRANSIHGDLPQRVRERALRDFSEGKLPVLVATDVAARGLDIDDVTIVIHYDPPEDHKAYLHRSGRTARAGDAGLVVTLVLWDQELEVRRLQKRIGVDVPLVEMFSNDARLADLEAWDPRTELEPA